MSENRTAVGNLFGGVVNKPSFKWVELIVFYCLFPATIILGLVELKYRWFFFGLTFVYVAGIVWPTTPKWTNREFWIKKLRFLLKWIALYLLALFGICFLLYWQGHCALNDLIFGLLVFAVYPVSAAAQELFFRVYFFRRYEALCNGKALFVLNVLLFAFYHKIYGNWLAMIFSLAGGVILTSVYWRRRLFWPVWALHAALGIAIFMSGLGQHFTDLLE